MRVRTIVRRAMGQFRLTAALLVLSASALAGCASASGAAGSEPHVTKPNMLVGITHTEYTADDWWNPAAVARARKLLARLDLQNQFIMGFGMGNPEPSPGVFQWADLDERVGLMEKSGRPIVLTLCGAPDWMKGGKPGETDWAHLGVAPLPQHYADFAKLAAAIARHFPEVHYFQVWSEMRGFYNEALHRWDYEGYTAMYNDVYKALKEVNPQIQVGGPEVSVDSWISPKAGGHPSDLHGPWGTIDQRDLDVISYWLQHKVGADFITVDGNLASHDGVENVGNPALAAEKLVTMDHWLRKQTTLPIWWGEVHVDSVSDYPNAQAIATATTTLLTAIADSGARVAFLWCTERCGGGFDGIGLWTPTFRATGGFPTPVYTAVMADITKFRAKYSTP